MRKLLVDIGNTLIKTALSDDKGLSEFRNWQNIETFTGYVQKISPQQAYISSVTEKHKLVAEVLEQYCPVDIFSRETPLPIKVHYKTKDTLGLDRVAAIMGAYELFPGKNNLVIDIGTCITYDFIDNECNYYGGAISPGINIRLKSLHQLTSKLPLVEISEDKNMPEIAGDSSANSISSGVLNGILFEIDGFISSYQKQYKDLNTIITGGDSYRFESTIKAHIFVAPKLILIGLNRILKENEEN
ncbi:MAG: type III pantothenate kinase [Cyclobacteriaceae bacterium]